MIVLLIMMMRFYEVLCIVEVMRTTDHLWMRWRRERGEGREYVYLSCFWGIQAFLNGSC